LRRQAQEGDRVYNVIGIQKKIDASKILSFSTEFGQHQPFRRNQI